MLIFSKARPVCRAFFCLLALLLIVVTVGGCVSTPQARLNKAGAIIHDYGFEAAPLPAGDFTLYSVRNFQAAPGGVLTVIIEGDGYAWVRRNQPSVDPTPQDPVGLHILTLMDKPAVYLGRPCQYVNDAACLERFWTQDRFSAPVIDAYMHALNTLATAYGSTGFHLIGYSGGGYITLALAALRTDIVHATTIAGVLDPDGWSRHHGVTPVVPAFPFSDLIHAARGVAFVHLCGESDSIVPCDLTAGFVDQTYRAGLSNHVLRRIPGAGHDDLWRFIK